MSRFNEEDEDLLEYIKEYERYARISSGNVEDFDDWFEDNYGNPRKKTNSPKKRKSERSGDDPE